MPIERTKPLDIAGDLLQRIDAFNRLYGKTIDEDDLEEWPNFFAPDGYYLVTTRKNHELKMPVGIILCENRAMMEDRISALRNANLFEPHTYRHLIDPPLVVKEKNEEYSVQTSFACFRTFQSSSPEIFCTGKYLDRVAEGQKGLQFLERIVVCDSERIDTLLVIPL